MKYIYRIQRLVDVIVYENKMKLGQMTIYIL